MSRKSLRFVLPSLFLLPAIAGIAGSAGGWAVITVEDLPDYVVAGEPVNLRFTVRQHGSTPLSGLRATVEAEAGRLATRATARPGRAAGQYTAVVTLPEPGDWTITIHSGFGNSRSTLVPVRAVATGADAVPRLPPTEKGRRLFVAKGCVTCHLHREVDGSGVTGVGPELTGRRYGADYLGKFLADPTMATPTRSGAARMPNLNLKEPEIAALVAFINAETQALR